MSYKENDIVEFVIRGVVKEQDGKLILIDPYFHNSVRMVQENAQFRLIDPLYATDIEKQLIKDGDEDGM